MTALLEIDLDAIAANWRALDAMHAGQTAGVVKADAYGLGATHVAPKLLAIGCRHFFTAHLSEALVIRVLLPGAMLAVLNGILSGEAAEFSARNIVPVCGALHEMAVWRAEARRLGQVLAGDPACRHRHGAARVFRSRTGPAARGCRPAGGAAG